MDFKPKPYQRKVFKMIQANPNMRMRSGRPSYEMVMLAKYLSGNLGKKYKADKIIYDESASTPITKMEI